MTAIKRVNRVTAARKALGLINEPAKHTKKKKQVYHRIACVFQGGGALGAYQVGAYRAISEKGHVPNFFAGVSIGSINCAIIAGNPPERQLEKLMCFWHEIAPTCWFDQLGLETIDATRHFRNQMGATQALLYGLPGFFKPRMPIPTFLSNTTPEQLSYYDTSELKSTLEQLIDFDRINDKKVTLCLGAVNVVSGEMIFFNNQNMIITADHVMASGALPPGFPAIKIDDNYYWDGGIYANTPLVTVFDALPELDTLCFVVDCFSLKGRLPTNMDELDERQKDIRFASHSRRLTNVYTSRQNLQAAIQFLGEQLTPNARENSKVQKILALGHKKRLSIVHIIYNGTPFSHAFKDYNFARTAIDYRMAEGYRNAMTVLKKPVWQQQSKKLLDCSIYGVEKDYFNQR